MMRGRYAPSPTGEMHLGNASSALLAWLSTRAQEGTFVMRMEDLDTHRVRPGLADRVLHDLAWLGLNWDEGPDRGGPHGPYEQTARIELYGRAFARLREQRRVYRCFCSRKDVAAAASAPQNPGDELRYAGTCRDLDADDARRRLDGAARYAWRFRVETEHAPTFRDRVRGDCGDGDEPPGDFVVHRSDEVPAYQLAVVVDDAAMGITEVVRGDDLLPSTAKQLLLYEALGGKPPTFGHVPLLLDGEGIRLSKRQQGITLRELRECGWTPERVVGKLAGLLGLRSTEDPLAAAQLIDGFSLEQVRRAPEGIVVDLSQWS